MHPSQAIALSESSTCFMLCKASNESSWCNRIGAKSARVNQLYSSAVMIHCLPCTMHNPLCYSPPPAKNKEDSKARPHKPTASIENRWI